MMQVRDLGIFINECGPYPGEIEVHVEEIDVSTLGNTYKPDPAWTFVDKAGHFHTFDHDGLLPTLRRVGRKYRCQLCSKRVRPGYVIDQPGGVRRTMPGRTSWDVQIKVPEPLGIGGLDPVSIRVVKGPQTLFGFASRTLTAANSDGLTYGWVGITELGRRP